MADQKIILVWDEGEEHYRTLENFSLSFLTVPEEMVSEIQNDVDIAGEYVVRENMVPLESLLKLVDYL